MKDHTPIIFQFRSLQLIYLHIDPNDLRKGSILLHTHQAKEPHL